MKKTRAKRPPEAVKVTVILTPEVLRRLDATADGDRRSRSTTAALLIERALDAQKAG